MDPRREADLLAQTFPYLRDTAAEQMEGEMPVGWQGGANLAAGPTESEIWWKEKEETSCER